MRAWLPILGLLSFALSGCGAVAAGAVANHRPSAENEDLGHFGRHGFYHAVLPYSVKYLDASQRRLVSSNWILDNFYTDKRDRTRPKESDEYMDVVAFDTTGDGEHDVRERVHRYDLRFLNRRTSAVIWHSTFPMSQTLADTELRVLAQKYVESVAGADYVTVSLGAASVSEERRHSARMLHSRGIAVDGHRAFEFTFEVANVEQLKLASDSRTRHVRIVMVRPTFGWDADGVTFPVLMVLGYSAQPDDFTRTVGDFARYVNQVSVNYDRFLEGYRARIGRCHGEPITVEFEIDPAGKVAGLEVEGLGHIESNARTGRRRVMTAADEEVEKCIRAQLRDATRFTSTGRKRTVRWRFVPSGASSFVASTPYETFAEASPTVPPPAGSGGTDSAVPQAQSDAGAAVDEAGLRSALDAHKADILGCVGTARASLSVRYSEGKATVSLRGKLAGTDEEGCVRHVTGALRAPPGDGSLIHVVR